MKRIILTGVGILLSVSLFSCSKITTNSGACASAGAYGSQSECQNSIGVGTCTLASVQSSGNNLACWQSNTQNQTGNGSTSGGTTTGGSTNGCTGLTPYWTMGAWSPATCTAGVTQLTRTVACSSNTCACADAQPSTTESCQPDLYNNIHYQAECTAKGGSLVFVDGNHVCSFATSCPSGWDVLTSGSTVYTITSDNSGQDDIDCFGGRNTVHTGYHTSFTPIRGVETVSFCTWRNCFGCKRTQTISATVTNVACY